MATITEDYVSFEIAKLLKDKGFYSEDCFTFYKENGETGFLQTFGDIADYDSGTCVIAPTLQMAMKWLREVHDIFIKLEFNVDEDIQWHPSLALIKGNKYIHTNELQWYDTYEQAVEAACIYVLKSLI